MSRPGDADLEALFRDPAVPWARVLNAKGMRMVEVRSLLELARARFPGVPDIEQCVDGYVARVGGARLEQTDPYAFVGNLARRLAGRPAKRPSDLYELPAERFGG